MKRFFLVLGLLFLAGCSTADKNAPPLICPDTGLMLDADTIAVFPYEINKPADGDIIAEGQIRNYRGGCKLSSKGGVDFQLEVDFSAKRGAKGTAVQAQELPYFIAMLKSDETVLLRQSFTTKVSLNDKGQGAQTEKHRIYVPGNPAQAGTNKIVIGFILTPAQLDLNEARKKAKE